MELKTIQNGIFPFSLKKEQKLFFTNKTKTFFLNKKIQVVVFF